jgi:CheY-like chemotaxis protein
MYKVLMIDDNPVEHLIVKRISERHGLFESLVCVDDAAKVLDVLEKGGESVARMPDIILLDLHMPKLSGWEFMKRFDTVYKKLLKKIDVYVLSSSVSEADRRASLCYPFVKGFYSKPMTTTLMHQLTNGHI